MYVTFTEIIKPVCREAVLEGTHELVDGSLLLDYVGNDGETHYLRLEITIKRDQARGVVTAWNQLDSWEADLPTTPLDHLGQEIYAAYWRNVALPHAGLYNVTLRQGE
jgi:hypothetical protein